MHSLVQVPIDSLLDQYQAIRNRSTTLCQPLKPEDMVVQPVVDVSPPKWHLGHTTWFFEAMILEKYVDGYTVFHPEFAFVFNSYYEAAGARVVRTDRGNLSRPAVDEVLAYRSFVDEAMQGLFEKLENHPDRSRIEFLITIGMNHEQQHQELLATDIKWILGHNPLQPAYGSGGLQGADPRFSNRPVSADWVDMEEGIYEIGFDGNSFCYDNELGRHKVYLHSYRIANQQVTNREYLEFMEADGYGDFRWWLSEGWEWVKNSKIASPQYWHYVDGKWMHYTMEHGLSEIDLEAPVAHVSYYEADAYAAWRGMRLPTEFEWEAACQHFPHGQRWEWTGSAYLPYPGFAKEEGAIGEYNGKFMVNQMVLRGGSVATPPNHLRPTYRNFFHAPLRWQFTGIRLATMLND
ncbi:MAG: ergothioneine biosynthesis protein EgtB [Bacteroidia bacterium]